MPPDRFPLTLLPGSLAVSRLDPRDGVPGWVFRTPGPLAGVLRTADELSVVCAEGDVPREVSRMEKGFRAFKLQGPIPFSAVGVVSGFTAPLAAAGIGVFVLSTFDTDYLLVKEADVDRASSLLGKAGFQVTPGVA
jgi:hypothetical protein